MSADLQARLRIPPGSLDPITALLQEADGDLLAVAAAMLIIGASPTTDGTSWWRWPRAWPTSRPSTTR